MTLTNLGSGESKAGYKNTTLDLAPASVLDVLPNNMPIPT